MGNYLANLFVLPFNASFCYLLLLFLLITFIFTFLRHYHVFSFYGMSLCFLVWEAGLDYPGGPAPVRGYPIPFGVTRLVGLFTCKPGTALSRLSRGVIRYLIVNRPKVLTDYIYPSNSINLLGNPFSLVSSFLYLFFIYLKSLSLVCFFSQLIIY